MSITKLPSGRWRAQVHDPAVGHNVSVSRVLGGPGTFRTKGEAKAAREDARRRLTDALTRDVTVGAWRATWSTDPLWARPKASTNLHNAERVKAFCDAHETLPLRLVDDETVRGWLAGGRRSGQVPALRALFSDAASAKAGRLIERNPWAGLGITKGRGRADVEPPTVEMVEELVACACRVAFPAFAAWLQVGAYTGLRTGELDALEWDAVDLAEHRVRVRQQWSPKSKTFTAPKNGRARWAILTPPAREALLALPRDGRYCFRPLLRGEHLTPSSRAYHWKAIRVAAGYDGDLYLATRHFAGSYMVNVLGLDSEDVAIALGHTDGGELVRRLYGHRSHSDARARVLAAYRRQGQQRHLRAVDEEAS